MKKAPISLQDLRRSLYIKAKAEPAWRFWGLYVHICKAERLYEAYQMAKKNDGAIGESQALVRFRVNALPMVLQAGLARPAVVQSSC